MKNIFTAEDFELKTQDLSKPMYKILADRANEKLAKIIESWPDCVVTLKNIDGGLTSKQYYCATQIDGNGATHRAKLAFIEEITKEPCKHKPSVMSTTVNGVNVEGQSKTCIYCGVELVARWEPKP